MDEFFYKGLANELIAKLGRVACFVKHSNSIGSYHEEILKSVLRPMLSNRFSLRTGFAFDPVMGQSQQGDILIVDEMHPTAYFFREGDFAIVHPNALVCVVEVKTTLGPREFKEAIPCLASFLRVSTKPPHPVPLLFAFGSPAFDPQRLDKWYKSTQLPNVIHYPWGIYALNRGLILLKADAPDDKWGHYVYSGEDEKGPKWKGLSVFLQSLRKIMLLRDGSMDDPFKHAKTDGMKLSSNCYYRFGSGIHRISNHQS